MQICFASNNLHKHAEIQALLGNTIHLLTLNDIGCQEELEESQSTIEGNANQKAAYVFEKFSIPCFADDTGLEVDALNGEPGVFSARYAGPQRNSADNTALLLKKMEKQANRSAQFKTVIRYIDKHGSQTFTGIVRGLITTGPRGTAGFGYDPVFIPEGSTRTFAEMTMQEKNQFSHRAKAMAQLIAFFKERFQ